MTRYWLEAVLQVIVPFLLAFFLLNGKTRDNFSRIIFFALIYILYQIVLILPRFSETLNFIDGRWNWDGKILGILFGAVCYFAFRKYFSEHDFVTIRQDPDGFKKALIASGLPILFVTIRSFFTGGSEFHAETLLFQLTMPGIDEELLFRGVLLGLLMTALRDEGIFGGYSAVVVTAILFGLMHALTLDKHYSVGFDLPYFLNMASGGLVFGWITMKSRSLLLAVLVHGAANFLAAWLEMIG